MSDTDPDFLALTQRQRTRIDRAFDRGLPKLRSSGRKRRKLTRKSDREIPDDAGGGFMDDAIDGEGGFMDGGDAMDTGGGFADDGGDAAGFMVDDGEGGGFMPDDDPDRAPDQSIPGPSRSPQSTSGPLRLGKIPFSSIPGLLTSLNLPADEDVLNVFRASATGWATDDDRPSGPSRKRGKGSDDGDEALGVERKDFRAVCAAIMGGDDEEDEGMEVDIEEQAEEGEEGSEGSSGDGDTFTLDDGSSLSSLSSDSEYGASRKKTRKETKRTHKSASPANSTPAKRPRTKKTKLEEAVEQGPLRLAGRQKEAVKDLWDMLKRTNNAEEQPAARRRGKGSANVLGREEVKMWAREMGEMWTEDEITDMVTLFSTQHEGRGLSFDDFGQVMLRARVV